MPSELDRYERYAAWCQLLNVKPASFETWRREAERIPELLFHDPAVTWRGLSVAYY